MQAVVLYGKEDLRLESVPCPTAGPGELVLRVGAATTCGTDLKVYRRGYHAQMLQPPTMFGHEVAGTVTEVGPGVCTFQPGDRVVALNSAPCDRCYFCRHGQPNLCSDLLFNNGAYAEFMRIPARIVVKNTLKLPNELPFEHAALTEPLACVVRGFEETGASTGDSFVVIGAGPIGLMFLRIASIAGCRVIAVVKRPDQAVSARNYGADEVVQLRSGVDVVAEVRALTEDGIGADMVAECVATPESWEQAVAMVRKGGTVNFFGGPPSGTRVSFDTNRLHYGDITLKASFHHTPETCQRAFELICSGAASPADFITATATLAEVPDVFRRMTVRSAEGRLDIKTAILPNVECAA
ncbi:zinc-dependent alcohol dehydrogenase [Terriglobus sp.]|uniref:zinc-dependent alcohol dehydrogenase n=1 Tax=Terriglobus sp. TaxID=1889013 RepID=UPI003B00EA47